jgi:(S)-citramalyl-CoA lyase
VSESPASPGVASPLLLRSVLFLSSLALDRLPEALSTGADVVCVDLEDSVPSDRKQAARGALLHKLSTMAEVHRKRLFVRINSLRSPEGIADLHALLVNEHGPAAVLRPR